MILNYKEYQPDIHSSCFVAENATVVGRVIVKQNSSIWYGAVIRGDVSHISIGENTNIQDNCIIHINRDMPTIIGNNVTVGHGAIIHACTIGDNVLVGMGAIILDGAVIEDNVIIGAGAIVTPGKHIPSNTMAMGTPAKVVRELTEDERKGLKESAIHYVGVANNHKLR